MIRTFRFDPSIVRVGAAFRHVLPFLHDSPLLRYDTERPAGLNDLVAGEVVRLPSSDSNTLEHDYFETLRLEGSGLRVREESFATVPCLGVVGNRYAPPYVIGGLNNPLTGKPNGAVRGGCRVDCLSSIDVLGFANHDVNPGHGPAVSVLGVLVDREGRSLNLAHFSGADPDTPSPDQCPVPVVLVAGHGTNSGKTTCVRSLVAGLTTAGLAVGLEKKTGTVGSRDLFSPFLLQAREGLPGWEKDYWIDPDACPAGDCLDACGVTSDVSLEAGAYVRRSLAFTGSFLRRFTPQVLVIELADGMHHRTNRLLMDSSLMRRSTTCLVYCPWPSMEAAAQLPSSLTHLGYGEVPVVLSGPVANEERYAMVREEIRLRLRIPVRASARLAARGWVPDGESLVEAVLERLERRP